MPISSMTGFARTAGTLGGLHWQWEIKSVNGKTLDVRCRLPAGYESLEPQLRNAAAKALKRGNIQASLTVNDVAPTETVRLNRKVLDQVLDAAEAIRNRIGGDQLRADALLSLRGVIETVPAELDDGEVAKREAAIVESFVGGVGQLAEARQDEGNRLTVIVADQIDKVEGLTKAARDNPARSAEALRTRLNEQIERILGASPTLEPDRLHQEAVLIATRSDIQEEIDRLLSHVASARALLESGEAVGRKFDFLAQEFNREANTLCSKSADTSLTRIGLELKTVIDQMREQVQNIE